MRHRQSDYHHHRQPSSHHDHHRGGREQSLTTNSGPTTAFPWNKQQQQVASRPQPTPTQQPILRIVPEERYEPMSVVHETITIDKHSFFCGYCQCPMVIRIRLEPCYHLICLDCLPAIIARNDLCPVCDTTCILAMSLHPNDTIYCCSGTCVSRPTPRQGKAFLNNRSLKCHEMLFHSEDDDDLLYGYNESPKSSNEQSLDNSITNDIIIYPEQSLNDYIEIIPSTDQFHEKSITQQNLQNDIQQLSVPSLLPTDESLNVISQNHTPHLMSSTGIGGELNDISPSTSFISQSFQRSDKPSALQGVLECTIANGHDEEDELEDLL